jgi:hypothetical protein
VSSSGSSDLSKQPKRKWRELFFTVQRIFPPSDLVGLDILRLMAVYNDIGRIIDCMRKEPANQTDPKCKKVSNARMAMYLRLTIGLLHEAMEVLLQMQELPAFTEMEKALDRRGLEALKVLREARTDYKTSLLRLMDRIRNKATFHYIRNEFAEGIKEFKAKRGEDVESSFILEKYPDGKVRAYYLLADHVRDAAGFGIVSAEETSKIIKDITFLQGQLFVFLDTAFEWYARQRDLKDEFREAQTT